MYWFYANGKKYARVIDEICEIGKFKAKSEIIKVNSKKKKFDKKIWSVLNVKRLFSMF